MKTFWDFIDFISWVSISWGAVLGLSVLLEQFSKPLAELFALISMLAVFIGWLWFFIKNKSA